MRPPSLIPYYYDDLLHDVVQREGSIREGFLAITFNSSCVDVGCDRVIQSFFLKLLQVQ